MNSHSLGRIARPLAAIASASLAIGLLGACSSDGEPGAAPSVVLQVGDTTAGSPWIAGLETLAERVSEETDGRVTIEVLPGSQLGGELDLVQQVKQGTLAMAQVGNPGYPELSALFIPYLFDDAKVMEFPESDIFHDWEDAIREREGVRVLGVQYYPARHITSNNPIESPSDLAGVKIRVPEIAALVQAFQNFGANPQAIPVTDTYLALQNGTITAEENPLPSVESYKFDEVQDYVALTYHAQTFRYLLVNEGIWQSIGEDDRATIERLFDEIAEDVEQQVRSDDERILADFESRGIVVTKPDLAPFIELTKSVGQDVAEAAWGPGILDQIRDEYGPR